MALRYSFAFTVSLCWVQAAELEQATFGAGEGMRLQSMLPSGAVHDENLHG